MVNGTLVKAGDYEVKFDQSTGELSVIKNGKVKAKTDCALRSAHRQSEDNSAENNWFRR